LGPRGRDPLLIAALASAFGAFALTFRGPRPSFWRRMTRSGFGLGGFALAIDPSLRRIRIGRKQLGLGLASALGLYAIFWLGDRMARRIIPTGGSDIDSVYGLRTFARQSEIAARLALVIAPAEELFWRGFVQRRLARRHGEVRGALLAGLAYGSAHLPARNPTLVAAATVAGGFWSSLEAAGMDLGSLIVSHALWDLLIFLVAPTGKAAAGVGSHG
jgi:membrane protease YdiL (CAAX protease family)